MIKAIASPVGGTLGVDSNGITFNIVVQFIELDNPNAQGQRITLTGIDRNTTQLAFEDLIRNAVKSELNISGPDSILIVSSIIV